MEIIFVNLPKYLDFLSILIRKCGYQVYYLGLSHSINSDKEKHRVLQLKHEGIVPLPLADLPRFQGFSEVDSDTEMKTFKRVKEIAPHELIQEFKTLFPDITNIETKLQIVVNTTVAVQNIFVTGKVNIYARANPNKQYLLIDFNLNGFFNPELAPNVRLIVLPFEILGIGVATVTDIFQKFLGSLKTTIENKGKSACPLAIYSRGIDHSRVAFVTHEGLDYGKLFQKNLFYSTQINSELHPEKLLHIDYSGRTSPPGKLNWVCIGNHRQSWISNIYFAFVAMSKGIPHIRQLRHILGLLILTHSYVIYKSFTSKLEDYPDLKMALIDYDVLCPKELILAFESKRIRTIATQERFLGAFSKSFASIILNDYLCNSQFAAENLKYSPLICIERYIPVGQYRSDKLLEAKKTPPPQILEMALIKGLRIITALGYHTSREWQDSQMDLLINWQAHQHFLDDMIQLSQDIPEVFIILRYKDVGWISLPIFAETIQKINSSENLIISTDYSKDYASYDFCAHSDLVIAKYTSLADECLSVGIPVLFHEYTHNTERIIADAFDYSPSKIMCYNYEELKERVQIILSGTPNAMTGDYEYLKNVVYGELGDGRVKERIHTQIEKMITEL